jgi:holin-like protein
MIAAFSILVLLQIVGDAIAAMLSLPFPGALIGMLILFVGLLWRRELPESLAATADGLHRHLGLFFVPIGISLAGNLTLLREQGLILLAIVVVSTWLSLAVIGLVAERLFARGPERARASDGAAERAS